MPWLYNESKLWWFLYLIGATVVLILLQQTYIVSDILYYNTYGDQLSVDTIEMMIGGARKYVWVSYLIAPLLLLLRVTFVACCFYTALFFKNVKSDFASCINIALKSDTVFLVFMLFNIMYQAFVPASNLTELAANPISLLYYLDVESIPVYLLYPVGLFNLSEFFYWGLMIGLVRYRYKFSTSESFSFVVGSYGIGLLIVALIFALILM
ncbi:MAG: hypothetical protein LBC84_05170 [Prevotellaceae bacterium]|nr:hypothetical protein [Prevotellaceae bacterium]